MTSSRPRRLFALLLSLPVLFLFLLYLDLFSTRARSPAPPDEILGFLHFVTSPDEAGRVFGAVDDPARDTAAEEVLQLEAVTPEDPVQIAWYALGSIAKAAHRTHGKFDAGWEERLDVLRTEYPLVVFSKSYCPYSKRAKLLLASYDLLPPPKVIEVDLRPDSSHIKTLLTRLTRRSTFPNVMLHGQPLGGSDDLIRLHEEGQLRPVLEAARVKVRWMGEQGEDGVSSLHSRNSDPKKRVGSESVIKYAT